MAELSSPSAGFTVLELIVVIAIIGILAGISITIPSSMRVTARDQERHDDVTSLIRRLEQSYIAQEVGGPAYPSTLEYLNDISSGARTATRLDKDALKAPNATASSSVIAATSNSTTAPVGGGFSVSEYVYQPLTSSGGLCVNNTSTANAVTTCTHFNFYYKTERDGTIHRLKSLHQQ